MKIKDMNAHEKTMYRLMDEATIEFIGGYENTMEDYSPETEEYKVAEKFLTMGHEKMAAFFYDYVMSMCKKGTNATAARFAGGEFLRERIERRLVKWGY